MRVLSWNLFHGRCLPAAGCDLEERFAGLLAGWEWDVALLQEVPPWWASSLARAAGAQQRTALTSRNALLGLRRALARRWPDLMKSNGGGANAVLARRPILAHRALRLRWRPERRVAQLVRLAGEVCVANYHASARVPLAEDELRRLWRQALAWADDTPLVLGGDLNLRDPCPAGGAALLASRDVDHVFARGLRAVRAPELLDRHVSLEGRKAQLSDHVPLLVELG